MTSKFAHGTGSPLRPVGLQAAGGAKILRLICVFYSSKTFSPQTTIVSSGVGVKRDPITVRTRVAWPRPSPKHPPPAIPYSVLFWGYLVYVFYHGTLYTLTHTTYTWTTDVERTPRRDSFLPSRDRPWLRLIHRVSWADGGNPGEIARSATQKNRKTRKSNIEPRSF